MAPTYARIECVSFVRSSPPKLRSALRSMMAIHDVKINAIIGQVIDDRHIFGKWIIISPARLIERMFQRDQPTFDVSQICNCLVHLGVPGGIVFDTQQVP